VVTLTQGRSLAHKKPEMKIRVETLRAVGCRIETLKEAVVTFGVEFLQSNRVSLSELAELYETKSLLQVTMPGLEIGWCIQTLEGHIGGVNALLDVGDGRIVSGF